MLRKIEYLIPAALEAVDNVLVKKYGQENIPSGYQSAISGFGTSLLQMGLLPTLAVYTDKESDADIYRDVLLKALFAIVLHADSKFPDENKQQLPVDTDGMVVIGQLLRQVAKAGFQRELKEQLMQAALAFKLAIRTYNLKKP